MATEQKVTTSVTHDRLDRVSALLEGIKADARQAEAEKDLFMLGVYKALLAVASPIVTKAFAHLARQERAAVNRAHKTLRKQLRASADASNGQQGAPREQ